MLSRKSLWLAASGVLMAGLVLSACAGATPTTAPAPTNPPATQAAPATEPPTEVAPTKKVAKINFVQEPDNLNPIYSAMYFSQILEPIWNAWAWDFDENNLPRPVLVTEMPSLDNGGISADGTVLTMHLRDDIVWSDGEPITSKDFVFTYQMTIDPANKASSVSPYDQIKSVEAPDDTTVVVTFNSSYVPWVATLWHGILPEHILQPVYDKDGSLEAAEWNMAPTVGAGPFVFAEWEAGSFLRFVRNDKYYGEPAKLDEIYVSLVTDNSAQRQDVISGNSDMGSFLDFSEAPEYKKAGITVAISQSGYNDGLWFRMDKDGNPALQDVNVRKAVALALDRFSINETILGGVTTPPATYWNGTPYEDPSLKPYPYDPEQAKSLLDAAGWKDTNGNGTRDKDGVELVISYGTNQREVRKQIQAVAEEQLKAVGIGVDLQNFESDNFFGTFNDGGPMATGQLDMFEYSDTTAWPDPDITYWNCSEIPTAENPSGGNYEAICDPELDKLFADQAVETNADKRVEMFHQISKIIYDKVYWLGLFPDPDLWSVGPRLQNVKFSGVTPLFNSAEWDVK
jgi:peptide/nickel transport system substrate-binding protein